MSIISVSGKNIIVVLKGIIVSETYLVYVYVVYWVLVVNIFTDRRK